MHNAFVGQNIQGNATNEEYQMWQHNRRPPDNFIPHSSLTYRVPVEIPISGYL